MTTSKYKLTFQKFHCAIDCIPNYPTHFDKKRENVTLFSVFCLVLLFKNTSNCNINKAWMNLRRNPPDVGVTSGQNSCTKTIYIVLQTSVGLF